MSYDTRAVRHYTSGGRNPNWQPVCGTCPFLIPSEPGYDGGWCGHGKNRVPPMRGWPNGFTPAVSSTGGCDLHPHTPHDSAVTEHRQER